MASNWSLCGVCDNRQMTKPSVVWCSECDEGLCDDCKEHHSVSKGTNKHDTVSIAEYKKLPTEVFQIAQICKLHNDKYELFCRKHDCPCCKKCVKSHNDCKGLTDINELIKNVKTSNAFYEIEQTLFEVGENVKRLIANRKENLNSLKDKKRDIETEIKQARTKINHHLDKLQDDLMKELIEVEQNESSKIEKLLITLKKKEKEIIEIQENFASIKHHASELQTFLTMKDIETDRETFIQSVIKKNTTNRVNISCLINMYLQQIMASMQKFGEINVSSDPCDITIQKRKDRQAQIIVTLPTRSIDNLIMTLQKHINTKLSNIHGCSMFPDGRMIFSCYQEEKIIVLKSDGSKDFEITTTDGPFDVELIGDDSIAVTSGFTNTISIIDLKKHTLKKSIKINSFISGVVFKDKHLIYLSEENGLQRISIEDGSISNIANNKLSDYNGYVTTFGNKLFYTNCTDNSVTCCDYHGNILWTFCERSVLTHPLGISVDDGGNVFVVGWFTNNVIVISPDGQRFRQLLSSEDGLKGPQVLHYDPSTNKLLVANAANDAFLYEVR